MRGLLLLCFDYSKVPIDEFNDWYDTEHIPERERTRGILNARRWLDARNPRISVAGYDLESVESLRNPEYLAMAGRNLTLVQARHRQVHPGAEVRGAATPAG